MLTAFIFDTAGACAFCRVLGEKNGHSTATLLDSGRCERHWLPAEAEKTREVLSVLCRRHPVGNLPLKALPFCPSTPLTNVQYTIKERTS
jgi:hypothetical protein